jgi:hypothetical protein
VHQIKPEVGGTYKMSFTNLTTGHSHSFGGEFLELVPNERIRHTDKFDDPNMPGQMQTTISLKKVSVGTELTVVQEGIPSVIPVEACYLGWQESLTLLTQLVEGGVCGRRGLVVRGVRAALSGCRAALVRRGDSFAAVDVARRCRGVRAGWERG